MDITKMTEQELKALAYDVLIQSERLANDLRLINQEIQKRQEKDLPTNTQDDEPSETN